MRLETLILGSTKNSPTHRFRNLKDFTLDFGSGRGVTALVGESGTGKSAALEALATIFGDLMAGKLAPAFAYRLAYRMGAGPRCRSIGIDADPDRAEPYRITARAAAEAQDEPADPAGGASPTHDRSAGAANRPLSPSEARRAPEAGGAARATSQIVLATHDPVTVGGLRREQVRILRREGGRTVADVPGEHPQGMGVTGLLTGELFGLSSTLDTVTERRLLRRNDLFVKQARTPEEDAELTRLSAELAELGFSNADFRDPDYALFARKMAQHRQFRQPALTPEQRAERDRIAGEIIGDILRET